ncbi:MAG: hydroxylamine reductase [Nitrospinota bacterium]
MSMFCYQCEMSAPGGCGSNEKQDVGICGKDETLSRLQDLVIFGVKGLSAYRHMAGKLGADTAATDEVISESMYFTLTNVNFDFSDHIAQLMKLGKSGIDQMTALSSAHTGALGVPTPVSVTQNKAEGKAILVSGHDLKALKILLKQTEGKGINVYTHSEMLPAHGYPELKKFSHLKGNIGKSWFDQTELFNSWSGAILVTTNCIVPLKADCGYADRIFGYDVTAVKGIKSIQGNNFSPLIEKALSCPEVSGFDSEENLSTGHHFKSVLSLAPQILDAVEKGKIRRFFVIAGCDAPGKGREYYRELALSLPEDCVIVTSSCGKFRFNDIDFGFVPSTEIPRYLDLGQCNDSNGAVEIALALSKATGIPLNDLPISVVLMWMEQKAVIILLGLLSLGIKDIFVGPSAPEFFNDDIVNFLVDQFNISVTGDAKTDMETMLGALPVKKYGELQPA